MKNSIREQFRIKRKKIPLSRRVESSDLALKILCKPLLEHDYVLSYASFGDEFCTKTINLFLAKEGKLLLPKIDNNMLRIFHISSPSKQLKKNHLGIYEPIPNLCQEASPSIISLTIVPGLAFDKNNHRLGYGRGFYDRFLTQLSEHSYSIGLGFKEQLSETNLPSTQTDFSLNSVNLF